MLLYRENRSLTFLSGRGIQRSCRIGLLWGPEFGCANRDDMAWLRFDRHLFCMTQSFTREFKIHKACPIFALAKFHAFGSSTNYYGFVAYREAVVGMDMTDSHTLHTSQPSNSTPTHVRFFPAGNPMAPL